MTRYMIPFAAGCALVAGMLGVSADALSNSAQSSTKVATAPIEPELSLDEQTKLAALRDLERALRRDPKWRSNKPAIEWIDIAYHGGVYDGNLEEVAMDAATMAAMQDSLFAILASSVKGETLKLKLGADPLIAYQSVNSEGYDRLIERNLVLEDVLGVVDEQMRARYLWRLSILERDILIDAARAQWTIHPSVLDAIRRRGRYLAPGDRYLAACRAKGVPVPPEFAFRSAEWAHQGSLNYTFISAPRATDVYAYKDESAETPGTCVALPRALTARPFNDGGDAFLIGVICQSKRIVDGAKHACFWDNLAQGEGGQFGERLNGQSQPMKFGFVTDGFSLGENCTNCHRGNNVFNIHPGTALDLAAAPAERGGPYDVGGRPGWYRPIGRDWDDPAVPYGGRKYSNPPPAVLPAVPAEEISPQEYPGVRERSCGDCHEIGSLDFDAGSYCAILADAAHWTMPPANARRVPPQGAAGWPTAVRPWIYRTHVAELSRVCGAVMSDVRRVP